MRVLSACDYVRDMAFNYYIVTHSLDGAVYGRKVYVLNEQGDKVDASGRRFKKVIRSDSVLEKIPEGFVIHARSAYACMKHSMPPQFRMIGEFLEYIGIAQCDIGIFGSFMLELSPAKDVDFCVYGEEAHALVRSHIVALRVLLDAHAVDEAYAMSRTHKFASFSSKFCAEKILLRRWSTLVFSDGVAMTIRFLPKKMPVICARILSEKREICGVVGCNRSDFMPRSFSVGAAEGLTNVWTLLWCYQSCVKEGDIVRVRGSVCDDGSICIESMEDYIDIL
ncbi:MAG TPA: hypothetical protein VK158_04715 [Acidobacteriota bacterium]|nr:hypothetical protein [Acidobacteriota bacterium]